MSDLDDLWTQMLDEAVLAARGSGRHEVAEYLDLRSRNDVLRRAGVQWLFEGLIGIAGEATREFATITIDREEPHNFAYRGANIAGSKLIFRHGVRCLTVEAGWTRTPSDGFMRGGALAIARMTHFGMAKLNTELHLKPTEAEPGWIAFYQDGRSIAADEAFFRQHFAFFIGA